MIRFMPDFSFSCRVGLLFLLTSCFLRSAVSAQAQDSLAEREAPAWSQLRRDVTSQWRMPTDAEVRHALQAAARSLGEVDQIVRKQGQYEQQWRTYLRWAPLEEAMAASAPPAADKLRLSGRLLSGAAALVAPGQPFREAADALDRAAVLIARQDATQQEYVKRTDELIDVLARVLMPLEQPATAQEGSHKTANRSALEFTPTERGLVERHINWLEQRGWAGPFQEFCRRFRQPNLTLQLSQNLLNAAVSQETTTQSNVRDSILGTTYVGNSTTRSKTTLELIPDNSAVTMRLLSTGQVSLRTTGHNNGSRVQTRSTTSFTGEKRIAWSPQGMKSFPASANATNRSQILDVSGRGAMANRVARRRASEQKAGTEREVGARTAAVVGNEMDKAIDDLVRSATNTYTRRLRIPLSARDALPRLVAMHSTNTDAALQLLAANSSQLATSTEPPALAAIETPVDATLHLHESAFNNLCSSYLAGRRVSDQKIGAMFEEVLGEFPEALAIGEDQKTWTISFQDVDPVVIGLRNDELTVTLRADVFEIGDELFPGAIITAVYQRTPATEGFVATMLKRLGVEVLSSEDSDGQPLGVRQQVFRSMVRRRFAGLFPQELRWQHVPLPDPWPEGTELRIVDSQVDGGWLTLAAMCETHDEPAAPGSQTAQ